MIGSVSIFRREEVNLNKHSSPFKGPETLFVGINVVVLMLQHQIILSQSGRQTSR